MKVNDLVPNNDAFFLPGGSTGCILLHGFTCMPEEMRPLGEYLAAKGLTVFGARLAGHATHPNDLSHIVWTDWLNDVEDGLTIISRSCDKKILIGQSLGGVIALIASTRFELSGVLALSTPYGTPPRERLGDLILKLLRPTIQKKVARFPPDHPLYHRRELNYPAYPEFPSRILAELNQLASALAEALLQAKVPVLLVQSRDDHDVPFSSLQSIYDQLGSQRKEMLAVEGMSHSLVMGPRKEVVFEAIEKFLVAITT